MGSYNPLFLKSVVSLDLQIFFTKVVVKGIQLMCPLFYWTPTL